MKRFGEVWRECGSLGNVDRSAFCLLRKRTPDPDTDCPAHEAFLLYLGDTLKFEKFDSLVVSQILRHFVDDLTQIATELSAGIINHEEVLQIHRLGFADNRYVSLTGVELLLDMEDWKEVPGPIPEIKLVSYNLTSLMLLRWGGVPLSRRLETPEPPPAPVQ